jgi:hypothetical protein
MDTTATVGPAVLGHHFVLPLEHMCPSVPRSSFNPTCLVRSFVRDTGPNGLSSPDEIFRIGAGLLYGPKSRKRGGNSSFFEQSPSSVLAAASTVVLLWVVCVYIDAFAAYTHTHAVKYPLFCATDRLLYSNANFSLESFL